MSITAHRPESLDGGKISACFFTRLGGASTGVYESLNCGPGSDDDANAVTENRSRALAFLSTGAKALCTLYQVHSNDVVLVDAPLEGPRIKADAMVTRTPGLALGILTADCAPVLLAAPEDGVIAAAHAGWRGSLAGVIEAVAGKMVETGAATKNIRAAVGPAIAQTSYEVGGEFRASFLEKDKSYDSFFVPGKPGHFQFDLTGFVEARLREAGVDRIENLALDTYAREDEFFSYRRSTHRKEPDYGRQLSAVCLAP